MEFTRHYAHDKEPQVKPAAGNRTMTLIEALDWATNGTYEEVKGAVFPFITDDAHYFEKMACSDRHIAATANCRASDFVKREWNGFTVAYEICWGFLYPGLPKKEAMKKEHLERFGIDEGTLYRDALSNLKKIAEKKVFEIKELEGSPNFSVQLSGPFPLEECSVLLLDEFYEGLYKEVGDGYFIMPMLRNCFTIVPRSWAVENGLRSLQRRLSHEIGRKNDLRLTDMILYYEGLGSEPKLIPDYTVSM